MDDAAKYQWIHITKLYILLELHEHDSANSLRDPVITAGGKEYSKFESCTNS